MRIVDLNEDSLMYVCICNAIREKDLRFRIKNEPL